MYCDRGGKKSSERKGIVAMLNVNQTRIAIGVERSLQSVRGIVAMLDANQTLGGRSQTKTEGLDTYMSM
jgi:hypothetical protein